MSEKRKPCFTFLLRYPGKKKSHKIEVFQASLWGETTGMRGRSILRYRLRANGKWYPEGSGSFFTKTEIKELLFRSIYF